jgi:hypothetical protein
MGERREREQDVEKPFFNILLGATAAFPLFSSD